MKWIRKVQVLDLTRYSPECPPVRWALNRLLATPTSLGLYEAVVSLLFWHTRWWCPRAETDQLPCTVLLPCSKPWLKHAYQLCSVHSHALAQCACQLCSVLFQALAQYAYQLCSVHSQALAQYVYQLSSVSNLRRWLNVPTNSEVYTLRLWLNMPTTSVVCLISGFGSMCLPTL